MKNLNLIQVIYHNQLPEGSQYEEFNLGLVTSDIKTLKDTFCPVVQDVDILIDPIDLINNR